MRSGLLGLSCLLVTLSACGPESPEMTTGSSGDTSGGSSTGTTGGQPTTSSTTSTTTTTTTTMASVPTTGGPSGPDFGPLEPTTAGLPACEETGGCHRLDLLIVVDNSSGMADAQKHLVASLPHLVTRLRELVGEDGLPVVPDVQVMVTTTDVGHPLCTPFEKPDYEPADGAPIAAACAERLERFTGLGANPEVRPDACLDRCPEDQVAVPIDPYVRFAGDSSNVIGDVMDDPVIEALECVVPQGIDGCGIEAPLESMLRALAPERPWNEAAAPFLRPGAALGVVLLTNETDCSVQDFEHFDPKNVDVPEFNQFWEDVPGMPGVKEEPTSAVCWNASMTCEDADPDVPYDSCVPEEKGVLLPISRYTDRLVGELGAAGKPVFMLVIAGIPAEGIDALVHRPWLPEDILPGDSDTPAQKEFEFGIGPGCTSEAAGNALPPGRIRQLCEALDVADDPGTLADESAVRCCFESACATDLAGGFDCLADALAHSLHAAG